MINYFMKKIAAILFLVLMLGGCSNIESPNKVNISRIENLENKVASLEANKIDVRSLCSTLISGEEKRLSVDEYFYSGMFYNPKLDKCISRWTHNRVDEPSEYDFEYWDVLEKDI